MTAQEPGRRSPTAPVLRQGGTRGRPQGCDREVNMKTDTPRVLSLRPDERHRARLASPSTWWKVLRLW